MHKHIARGLALMATLATGLAMAPAATAAPKADLVPDDIYLSCIDTALDLPDGTQPTTEQLAGITSLNCTTDIIDTGLRDPGPTSIAGTQYMTGLRSLRVDSDTLSDISPVSGLTGLTSLSLGSNSGETHYSQVRDISPLRTLTGLQELNLGDRGSTESFAPLTGLPKLTDLQIQGSTATRFDSLSRMTGLKSLTVRYGKMDTLTWVKPLKHLKWLDISNNRVADVTDLAGLKELTHLDVSGNRLADLSPLAGLGVAPRPCLPGEPDDPTAPGTCSEDFFAQGQTPAMTARGVGRPVPAPAVKGLVGHIEMTSGIGLKIQDGKVTYPRPGRYTWRFESAGDWATTYSPFDGTATVTVTG